MKDLSHLNLSWKAREVLAKAYPNADDMDEAGWRAAIRKYADRTVLDGLEGCTAPIAREISRWAWSGPVPMKGHAFNASSIEWAFSTRAHNALSNQGLLDDGKLAAELALELTSMSDWELLRIPNFGRKTLREVRAWAASVMNETGIFAEMRKQAHDRHAAAVAAAQSRLDAMLAEIAELEARTASPVSDDKAA